MCVIRLQNTNACFTDPAERTPRSSFTLAVELPAFWSVALHLR